MTFGVIGALIRAQVSKFLGPLMKPLVTSAIAR